MRQLQPVLWSKGTVLTPQHLQTQDRYVEDLISFQIGALVDASWGFSRLAVDRNALAGGRLVLLEAVGIFPDGVPFQVPSADPPPPPRVIEGLWSGKESFLEVHLAMPSRRPGAVNVARHGVTDVARFVAETIQVPDETAAGNERTVEVARKNLRLITAEEAGERHASLPFARIRRRESGEFELDPVFVPPLLDFSASDLVRSVVRSAVELLTSRGRELGSMRREGSKGLADFGLSNISSFWLLYTVNTHLPRFRQFLHDGRGRPLEVYDALCELAGSLTTFSKDFSPRDIPPFQHSDPGAAYRKLDEMVRHLLATVVPSTHATVPLLDQGASTWVGAIEQDEYLSAPGFFLAVKSSLPPNELVKNILDMLKLASSDRIEHLAYRAIPGLPLRHVPVPPEEVPRKLGYQYFSVERTGPEWDAVLQARNVAAFASAAIPDPTFELVILLRAPVR